MEPLPTPHARPAGAPEPGFAALHRRYAPVVHGLLLARVPRADVEDLLQEVFVRLHRERGRLRAPEAVGSWLVTVTCKLARDHLRRLARRPREVPLAEAAQVGAPGAGAERERERVLAALRELPETYRDALVLRLVEGLSGREIAARTGLTEGSVRVHLTRGYARLRTLLERRGWKP